VGIHRLTGLKKSEDASGDSLRVLMAFEELSAKLRQRG